MTTFHLCCKVYLQSNLPCLDPFLETKNWHKFFYFVLSLIQVWLMWNYSNWAFYRGCASTNMCKYIISNLVVIHLLILWKPYYLSHEEQKYLVECQWTNKKNVKWLLQLAILHWSFVCFLVNAWKVLNVLLCWGRNLWSALHKIHWS
jgi:hypothetical protein